MDIGTVYARIICSANEMPPLKVTNWKTLRCLKVFAVWTSVIVEICIENRQN